MFLGNSVIANAGTLGSAVSLQAVDAVTVIPPAAFTGVITLEVSGDDTQSWADVTSSAVIVLVVGGQSVTLTKIHGSHLRVTSTLAEGAERTIAIHGSGPRQV